jgi:hypothetical protein
VVKMTAVVMVASPRTQARRARVEVVRNNMNFPVPIFTLDHRSVRLNYAQTTAACLGRKPSTRTVLSAGMADQVAILAKMLRRREFSTF